MKPLLIIVALTLSSSIDNLGVGLSYGIRNIRISYLSNLWIATICFLFSIAGISFGLWIAEILPESLPVVIGSILLVIIGLRIMLLAAPRKEEANTNIDKNEPGKIKSVIQDPTNADFDNSKDINFIEATVLGVALSANALTNGVGAGLLGFSPLLISILAAIGSYISVWGGCVFGVKLAHVTIGRFTVGQFGTLISGALLMVIAVGIFF